MNHKLEFESSLPLLYPSLLSPPFSIPLLSPPISSLFSPSQTPLIVAAKNGHFACAKLLIQHGADMLVLTSLAGQELTVCEVSANNGHHKISKYLQGCIGE